MPIHKDSLQLRAARSEGEGPRRQALRIVIRSFSFSEAGARRIRRGAFLPLFLIVPLATIYGLDPSKSQPMHFLITFTIGVVCAGVVVSISWHAAKRRIDELSRTSLAIGDGKLKWTSGMGKSDLDLKTVTSVVVRRKRGSVRSMTLSISEGRDVDLEGLEDMEALLDSLRSQIQAELFETKKWFQF